ncbi:mismatch-specific DNA-glycosylase [Brachybacterium hainanense]|uniref:Mismatch-specific DNA-glycosylase n=1 Tax=Brachybacterium hainanense TaxID=1541174 RepID=A0ABV6R7I9_9MICO
MRVSPLSGARPSREDLARFAADPPPLQDVMPPGGAALRLLIVGINPGLWTAAVNAPFAHPGNRFWPSLHRAGIIDRAVDASRGLDPADEQALVDRGIGMTNLVARPTARADELSREELREGGERLRRMVQERPPRTVSILGITAFRIAYRVPRASMGRQELPGWPDGTALWVLPQPSGLNAHETIDSLADRWREVWGEDEV